MKKIVSVVITLLALCCLLSISAAAETTIQTPAIASASLSFNGNVHMYFNVYFGETAPTTEDYGVIFWTEEQTAANYTYEKATAEGAPARIVTGANADDVVYKDHPCKVFRYSVDAKCMTDMVYAQGYMKDGDTYSYSKVVPYSVQTYAGRKLGIYPNVAQDNISTNQDFINMIKALLDYGATAQINFDYRTDDLANTILKWSRGVEYRSNGDGTCYVNRIGTCTDTELYIPKVALDGECAGMKVTSIGAWVFQNCQGRESITIPNSVTSIGNYAFEWCSSLTSITIPDSVTSIGRDAFSATAYYNNNANWENDVLYIGNHLIEARMSITGSYTIKSGTKCVADGAFSGCRSLTSITIPDSVTSIGEWAFYNCSSLTSIMIPEGVTSIGYWAFSNCSSLYVVRNNSALDIKPGSSNNEYVASCAKIVIDANGNMTSVGDGSEYILTEDSFLFQKVGGEYYLLAYIGGESTITLPSSIEGSKYEISEIRGVVNVIIPEGVTSIGYWAFYNCSSLTSIMIPEGVTSIDYRAFYFCDNLKSITIPESVMSIGEEAFFGCSSLESITIPESVMSIGEEAFSGCSSLTSITVDPANTVYHSAGGCLIKTASKELIAGCKNSVIPTDGSVTSIGDSAFSSCSLTSITIPEGVTSIGNYAFEYCSSLASITIPDSVMSIGSRAFYNCSSLTSITIPDSVTSIGGYAFYECSSLTSITFKGTRGQWDIMSKGTSWNIITPAYTIHCTDGDISK